MLNVLAEACQDCPFKGRFQGLRPGRLRDIMQGCEAEDNHFVCHRTIRDYYDVTAGREDAVCAGWLEAAGGLDEAPGQLLRIAQRLGAVRVIDPPT